MVTKKLPKKKVTKKVTRKKIITKSGKKLIKKRNPHFDFNDDAIKNAARWDAQTIIIKIDNGRTPYQVDFDGLMQNALWHANVKWNNKEEVSEAKKIYISEIKRKLPSRYFNLFISE